MSAPRGYDARNSEVARVLWIVLFLNGVVALAKVTVGILAGSVTVLADGFHSTLDGTNNIVGLVAMRVASRPADEDHPYGHDKFENLASAGIGGMVFLLAFETIKQAYRSVVVGLSGGSDAAGRAVEPIFFVVIGVTLLINLIVSAFETRVGRRLESTLLTADAGHTRSDTLVTGVGVISLVGSRYAWWIDPVLATGVAVILFRTAWSILRESVNSMTDRIRLDPHQVLRVADSVPGVRNTHAIRSHGTPTNIHLDLHIVVAEDLSARETTVIEERVIKALREAFPTVTEVSIHHQTEMPPDPAAPLWKD